MKYHALRSAQILCEIPRTLAGRYDNLSAAKEARYALCLVARNRLDIVGVASSDRRHLSERTRRAAEIARMPERRRNRPPPRFVSWRS